MRFSANTFVVGDVPMGVNAEQAAKTRLLLAQAGWVRRLARALLADREEAEDLAQEALLRGWHRPDGQGGRAWLATMVRNLSIDRFRSEVRRTRREEKATDSDQERVASPEELVGNAEIHRHVAEAVAGLAEPFRQTLVLRFYQGLSAADIARQLGQSDGTIRWRIKEGLERVRKALDARHGDQRSAWVAALAPLLPRSMAGQHRSRPSRPHGMRVLPVAAYVSVASITILGVVAAAAAVRKPRSVDSAMTDQKPEPALATDPSQAKLPRAGLQLAKPIVPVEDEAAARPPGPGTADARALAEELLLAVQSNDYDAFVAKGSPIFRAAVAPAKLESSSAELGGRLSEDHTVEALGNVRRNRTVDWLFRIRFPDDGDDALVTLAMDGWQVAGFFIHEPIPLPVETTP